MPGIRVLTFMCLLSLVSFIGLNAHESISLPVQDAEKPLPANIPLENSLLWEITGKGLSKPSYLFGTIHLICDEDFFWSPPFEKALNNSEEIVFEIDYEEVIFYYKNLFDQDILKKYYSKYDELIISDPIGVKSSSGAEEGWSKLSEKLRKLENNNSTRQEDTPDAFERLRSKMLELKHLSFFLQNNTAFQNNTKSDCDRIISYELKITEMGLVKGKSFGHLETVEEQMYALASSTDAYRSDEDKQKAADDESSYQDKFDQLVSLYTAQDLMGLYEFMTRAEMGLIDLDAVLFDRNEKWTESIMEMLSSGKSFFIAVGAGHMGSERGLIQSLIEQGYTLRPVYE